MLALKAHRKCRSSAPLIFNLGTKCTPGTPSCSSPERASNSWTQRGNQHSGKFQYLVFPAAPISRYSESTDVIRAYFMLERKRGTLGIRPCTDRRAPTYLRLFSRRLWWIELPYQVLALHRNTITSKPADNDSEIPTIRHCTVRTINTVLLVFHQLNL